MFQNKSEIEGKNRPEGDGYFLVVADPRQAGSGLRLTPNRGLASSREQQVGVGFCRCWGLSKWAVQDRIRSARGCQPKTGKEREREGKLGLHSLVAAVEDQRVFPLVLLEFEGVREGGEGGMAVQLQPLVVVGLGCPAG